MKRVWHIAGGLLLSAGMNAAQGGEAWQAVYEDASIRVAVDAASIRREKQTLIFRERHVLATAEIDPESLRRIVEIQYRRLVDCRKKRSAVLSRAMFSDQDALVHYESSRPGKLNWLAPNTEQEIRLYEWACGTRPG
jgi:protoheme ferro-lyase